MPVFTSKQLAAISTNLLRAAGVPDEEAVIVTRKKNGIDVPNETWLSLQRTCRGYGLDPDKLVAN